MVPKMFSLIVKETNLRIIKTCIVKSKFLNSVHFKRTLLTSKISYANNFKKLNRQEVDVHEYVRSFQKDPKDFGKIVSLDIDDVKSSSQSSSQENMKRRRKKKLKNLEEKVKVELRNVDEVDEEKVGSREEVNKSEKLESSVKKLKYTTYDKEPHLLRLVMSNLKSKQKRQKEEKIMLEGKRIIHEAISAGFQPIIIFFSRKSDVEKLNLSDNVKLCKVPYKTLQLWSDVITSQGVIGVFDMPDLKKEKEITDGIPLTVICDNIREPGNMGCILRLVAGVGCKKVILTKGCVDIWDSKVLRAAAGAHFHLSIVKNLHWNDIEKEVVDEEKIVLADIGHNSVDDTETEEKDEEKSGSLFKIKSSISDGLPLVCYNSVNYEKQSVVIVIGGETTGLSEEAYLFAEERQGVRVFIPMCNNIESLNSAVALGILSYEVRRQMDGTSNKKSQKGSCCDESRQMDGTSNKTSQKKSSSDESPEVVTFNIEPTLPVSMY